MTNHLPSYAPRGKAFGVMWLSHVCGGTVMPIEHTGRFVELAHAQKECARIDYRLHPQVVVVDQRLAIEKAKQ